MNVVILAAGFATRLHPLTLHQAKPLLDVAGRPVLSWILDRIWAIPGLGRTILISNGRFAADFEEFARDLPPERCIEVVNDGALTDATRCGALRDLELALARLPETEPVLVVGGDNLVDFDLRPHAESFRRGVGPLLLARSIPEPIPPRRYSEVVFDAAGSVTSFREKPAEPRSAWSCICLYFFEPGVQSLVRAYLSSGGEPDAPGHFLAWLATRQALRAEPIRGPWFDIGNFETLEAARRALAGRSRGELP